MAGAATSATAEHFTHRMLANGVELGVDHLPRRKTVALYFRMLCGLVDEPDELAGVHAITARLLSKGTERYDGRGLADAFDALGAQWRVASGRQAMMLRVVCLPEFVPDVIALAAEMFCRPTFPVDACSVAVELAQQELRHLEDEPQDLLRIAIQELTLGPVLGRYVGGKPETLALLTPDAIRGFWKRAYHRGRLQIAVAGAVDEPALVGTLEDAFADLGQPHPGGREPADFTIASRQAHREKDAQQEYVALTLPGVPKEDPQYPVEQVLVGVLSGGMSGRLFTEVREKQGLVYWVGAWAEHLRGKGVMHLGASTTPERCQQTYDTLLRELARVAEDLTADEVERSRNSLIAHSETEDDLTRARAGNLSDDLFHFARPVGLQAKLDALRGVTLEQVAAHAAELADRPRCVATVGPRPLERL